MSSRAGTLLDSVHFVAYLAYLHSRLENVHWVPAASNALDRRATPRPSHFAWASYPGALPHEVRSSRVAELPYQQRFLAQPTNCNKRMTDAQRDLDTVRDET